MQRLNLKLQQVEILLQSRMPLRPIGVVVQMPVMALGEDGDAVHMSAFERAGEFTGVEIAAHIADPRAGVKIEVNLAEAHGRGVYNARAVASSRRAEMHERRRHERPRQCEMHVCESGDV